MTKRSVWGHVGLAFLVSVTGAAAAGPDLGDAMPRTGIALSDVSGRSVGLESLAGDNGTLVVFTSGSCPEARDAEQRIVELLDTYRARLVATALVEVGPGAERGAMQERASAHEISVPFLADPDGRLARALGVTGLPEALLFNASGKLAWRGGMSESPALVDALEAVIERRPVAASEVRPSGCRFP